MDEIYQRRGGELVKLELAASGGGISAAAFAIDENGNLTVEEDQTGGLELNINADGELEASDGN